MSWIAHESEGNRILSIRSFSDHELSTAVEECRIRLRQYPDRHYDIGYFDDDECRPKGYVITILR